MSKRTKKAIQFRESLKEKLGEWSYSFKDETHKLIVELEQLVDLLHILRDHFGFNLLLDIIAVDNIDKNEGQDRFEVSYLLLNMEFNQRLLLQTNLKVEEQLPSVFSLWENSLFIERENWDLMGIDHLEGKSNKRIFLDNSFKGHPLRKDYKEERTSPIVLEEKDENFIYLVPSHPGAFKTLEIKAKTDGEKAQQVSIETGLLHHGLEKKCEITKYNKIITLTDHLNDCSSGLSNIAWCMAVENILGCIIPERACALRMIFMELSRIRDHLFCISSMFKDLGYTTYLRECFSLKELISSLVKSYCEDTTGPIVSFGGMAFGPTLGWEMKCVEAINHLEKELKRLNQKLTNSSLWGKQTRNFKITGKDAIKMGMTGPCLRASGINYDLRKSNPYYFYNDIDFKIPLGMSGESYDRYLVRFQECFESINIIRQVIQNLPSGKIMNGDFSHQDERELIPVGELYSSLEGSSGELGFFIVALGENHPYRVKIRPPSLSLLDAYIKTAKGERIEDLKVGFSSFNIIVGELER